MTLTYAECLSEIRDALGASDSPAGLNENRVIRDAGIYLLSWHRWSWMNTRTARLNLRGQITFSDGDWTETSKTLNSTGAFTNYTFVDEDELQVTAGTGVTTGYYEVASRTDDDNIVLTTSLSTAGTDLSNTDITVEFNTNTVTLPSDFLQIVSLDVTDGLFRHAQPATLEEILERRTSGLQITLPDRYYYAVNWVGTSPPTPVLEVYPEPGSNQTAYFSLQYRTKFVGEDSDQSVVRVPEYMEGLFIQLVREWALGLKEHDNITLGDRLAALSRSPQFEMAKRVDGGVQGAYGEISGGHTAVTDRRIATLYHNGINIGGPS